jgi:TonB-dependent starch-binding outer membrane protein SusC
MRKFYLSFSRYLTVLLILVTTMAWSQSRTVTGKVTSAEDNTGLPGVNVVEKGTNNGTVTDVDGNYSLNVGDNATLVFSFVGFTSQEIVVGTQSSINVNLASDVTSLDEVVVVGYGTQEKKEITSAVASVKAEDFNKGIVNDPAQLLQGKVAGLNITRPGGDPNGGFNIRLRGITTFGANAEPLIVIDGVIGGSLSTVDPNDIASMDVLKDGSAAAIYGSRGGSGVILITTKSGKAGKTKVEYNGSVATESIANTIDFMSADEFRNTEGAVDLGANTDWLDEVTRNGSAMVHNLSLSGGSDKTTYYAAFNTRMAKGIALNSGFNQLNGRINLTQKALKDRATFTANFTATSRESQYGFKESLRYAIVANPTMPIFDNTTDSPTAGGNYGGYAERDIFDFFNPLSIAKQNKNDGKDTRFLMNLRGEYDFSDLVEGFRVGVAYSQQRESDFRGVYYAKTAKFRGSNRNGLAGRSEDQRTFDLFETTLNYDKAFGSTNLAVLGGYSYQEFFYEGFGVSGGDFLTDAFTYNNISENTALDFKNGLGSLYSYANSDRLVAFFGRAIFNFNENYYLNASARYEGSSRFGANNKWGLFPAVSAGVTLSNLMDIPAVNNLKLRVSWGVTGNRPGQSYASLQRFGTTGSSFFVDGAYVPSYAPVSNANPDLKWETKDELDFGADFTLLDSKLSGTIDYYTRNTKDLLLFKNVPVPPNLYGQTLLNIGELKNSGIEVALNYVAISKSNLNWTTGVNFATFKTEVVSLTNSQIPEGSVFYTAGMGAPGQNAFTLARVKEGEELGQLWGPIQETVNSDGTPQFKDLNGDGSYCDCDDDKTVIGHGLPKFTAGWNNTISFGNFDLNLFFRGAFGHDLVNSYRGFYENRESTTLNNYNIVKTKYYDPSITKAAVNDTHVEKADFVKLDNATLGYNFKMSPGAAVSKVRLYFSGQNLFVITGYTGIDPEVRYVDQIDGDGGGGPGAVDPFAPGIERRSTYFTTRTFTVGVNVGF